MNERRGDGVWLLIFLALLVGAKPAADAATPPHHHARGSSGVLAELARPSRVAAADIPPAALAAYRAAARTCPHLTWPLLAGIGRVESNHGRSTLPGVHSGQNFAGAAGPMQMGNGTGKAGNAWGRYGDGVPSHVYLIGPAAKGAARMLCADGVRAGRVTQAIYAYNCGRPYCAVSAGYVAQVLTFAHRYQAGR